LFPTGRSPRRNGAAGLGGWLIYPRRAARANHNPQQAPFTTSESRVSLPRRVRSGVKAASGRGPPGAAGGVFPGPWYRRPVGKPMWSKPCNAPAFLVE
jgi:hypothetical protein